MIERYIGGEEAGRSLFGGRRNNTRNLGLGVVFLLALVLVMVWQLPGLVVSGVLAALVFLGTMETAFGSPWERIQARRRWRDRVRSGRAMFRPVHERPDDLTEAYLNGGKRGRKRLEKEWNTYRDWPDGVQGLNWLQAVPGRPGILWHTPTGEEHYLSVAWPVDGQIRGLEGDAQVDAAARRFGQMLAGWGGARSLVSRVQVLTRVIPVDSARHEEWVLANVDVDCAPELLRSYDSVVRQLGSGGLMQRHFVVVRWPVTAQFRSAAARRGPGHAGWRSLMLREIEAVTRRLEAARMHPGRPLTAAQLAAVLRHQQMPSWPIDQAGDVDVVWPWLASEDSWSVNTVRGNGPAGEPEEWLHRTAQVPVRAVGTGARNPLWLLPVLTQLPGSIVRTLSVELEMIPAAVARQQARSDLASDLADLHAQAKKGALTSEELEVSMASATARRADLAPGNGAHGAAWAIHVSVSARTSEELLDACSIVEEAFAEDLDVAELKWLDPDQAAASAACWPVARGMRPVKVTQGEALRGLLAGRGNKEELA